MHFVTGGAYNGKSKWVKEFYREKEILIEDYVSAYKGDTLPRDIPQLTGDILMIEGLEHYIRDDCLMMDSQDCRAGWRKMLDRWKNWEQCKQERQVVIIGTDITKGIVPMDLEERKWRDLSGWIFQDISLKAERVDLVWYGLNKQLK